MHCRSALTDLAKEISIRDAPVLERVLLEKWGLTAIEATPEGLFEAALLSRTCNQKGQRLIDFYYSRERDFVISYWARDWPVTLARSTNNDQLYELTQATQTAAGVAALRWFLSQAGGLDLLKQWLRTDELLIQPLIHKVLLSCVCSHLTMGNFKAEQWIKDVTRGGLESKSIVVKIEAAKLLAIQSEDREEIEPILFDDEGRLQDDLVIGLLSIEDEYPLSPSSVGSVVMDALYNLHIELGEPDYNDNDEQTATEVTELMDRLLDHTSKTLRSASAKVYSHIASFSFLSAIRRRIVAGNSDGAIYRPNQEHAEGIAMAARC